MCLKWGLGYFETFILRHFWDILKNILAYFETHWDNLEDFLTSSKTFGQIADYYFSTDGRTDGWTDGRTDQRTDGRTDSLIEMRRRILKERNDGRTDRWIDGPTDRPTDRRTDGPTDGQTLL